VGDLEYNYDADGRVIEKAGSFAQTNLPEPVSGNTFNADNEMTAFNGTAFSYDTNGNVTNDATNTYAWDARNHLSTISGGASASFVYDPFGRRISKTVGSTATSFLYDGLNPVQELQSGVPSANTMTGLGIDEYFQRNDASGASSYLTDRLGSTMALANSAGGLATTYTYDPFGNTTVSGSSTNPFQFTGRENDATGLFFYRARYYSPTYQRFISQDPRTNIGSLNPYAYTLNDPINLIDPLGLFPWPWGLPINIVLGGGSCGLVGGVVGGATGGAFFGPPGAIIGATAGNLLAQEICNDPCAGALNCNEDQMLPPAPPPSYGPICSEQHP
jgi:RHS repeat-associated protein